MGVSEVHWEEEEGGGVPGKWQIYTEGPQSVLTCMNNNLKKKKKKDVKRLATESIIGGLKTLVVCVRRHLRGDSWSLENRGYSVLYFTRYLLTLR